MAKGDVLDRLITERNDLHERHERLWLFLDRDEKPEDLSFTHLGMLYVQVYIMRAYGEILDRRIDDLGGASGDLDPFYNPDNF
jgi:hypothetical protein